MTGLNTFSSKCPLDPATVSAVWLPITCTHIPRERRSGGSVVACLNVPRAHHGEGLALRGVDLARHDARAGLIGGQRELAQPTAGSVGLGGL
jgi:hypothetical protein